MQENAYAALPFPMPSLLATSFQSCGLRDGVVLVMTSVRSLAWSLVRVLSAIVDAEGDTTEGCNVNLKRGLPKSGWFEWLRPSAKDE